MLPDKTIPGAPEQQSGKNATKQASKNADGNPEHLPAKKELSHESDFVSTGSNPWFAYVSIALTKDTIKLSEYLTEDVCRHISAHLCHTLYRETAEA